MPSDSKKKSFRFSEKRKASSTIHDDEPPRKRRDASLPKLDLLSLLSKVGGEQHYPIQRTLCRFLEVKDIVNLAKTSIRICWLYYRLLPTQWNLHTHLKPFVKDPLGFRKALGYSHGLITGTFALQFFERDMRPRSDMDVFVQYTNMEWITRNLEEEGYQLSHEWIPDGYNSTDLNKVHSYTRTQNDVTKCIKIFVSLLPATIAVLRSSYMTASLNFISCNDAYSLFPLETFVKRRSYLLKNLDNRFGEILKDYETHGWDAERLLNSRNDKLTLESCKSFRIVGGRTTWKMACSPQVTAPPDEIPPASVIDCNQYKLTSPNSGWVSQGSLQQLHLHCDVFEHTALEYEFSALGSELRQFISGQLDYLSALNTIKCPVDKRPTSILRKIRAARSSGGGPAYGVSNEEQDSDNDLFEPPEGWEYFDRLVPQFLTEFKQSMKDHGIDEERKERDKMARNLQLWLWDKRQKLKQELIQAEYLQTRALEKEKLKEETTKHLNDKLTQSLDLAFPDHPNQRSSLFARLAHRDSGNDDLSDGAQEADETSSEESEYSSD